MHAFETLHERALKVDKIMRARHEQVTFMWDAARAADHRVTLADLELLHRSLSQLRAGTTGDPRTVQTNIKATP